MAAFYEEADYLLDIQTKRWGTNVYLFSSGQHVFYEGNIRLINARDNTTVAETDCKYSSKGTGNTPNGKELYSNNGELIKVALNKAVEKCTQEFKESFFRETTEKVF